MTWQQTRPLARAHSLPLQLFGETFIPEMPTFLPNTRAWRPEQGPMVELEPELSDVERAGAAFKLTFGEDPATDQGPWRQHTCADYRRAYASGQSTPSQVAERVITAVAASEEQDPAMCLFTEFDPDKVRAAAAASTERWRNGSPLSPLDGVPFGVKDLVDVLGYKTTAGTSWMADWRRVEATIPAVAALLSAGALLLGKLATHEIGLGTTGLNTWFEDASPEVLAACRAAVEKLRGAGLEVVDIVIPELRHQRLAHSVTICSEMRSAMSGPLSVPAVRCQLDGETRASLTNAVGFTGAFYVNAQRVRTRGEAHFRRAFAACDLVLTPTTPAAAPRCKPGALAAGETDLATTLGLMRFITPANFLGFPALTLPVGVDAAGLPLGLQLMAPPWHEAGLLHAGAVLEAALGGGVVPRPRVWYDLLRD
ncbi:Glutamyl-tRNA(Gln) amidotransferase subunit A [Auxenochlorella protothecoides]|uniref:Glutamyl-tRNA(Gln) amidotransferase subunit A n=1 Tax=Auxenochlorella protothecoides TaxID=3075 RepID=A0A087SPK9_AUXPR|nr:Glutamyl-tRNA(Gln) amidotransferase subunit A [Auxenochlorella protothecoides]KFM27663.1 Glutamyl-tRNA(Gln) amidotransferase subunit A [Auxenochlorella protothecoides]